MKRFGILWAAALILTLGLSGCSSPTTETTPTVRPTASADLNGGAGTGVDENQQTPVGDDMEQAGDDLKDAANSTGDAIKDAGDAVVDGAKNAANDMGRAMR